MIYIPEYKFDTGDLKAMNSNRELFKNIEEQFEGQD